MVTTTENPPPSSTEDPPARRVPPPRWWRRPWMAPLGFVAVMFLAFSVPPYLTGDPAASRVPQPAGFTAHYPLLVAHVVFASIAMLTCFMQVWPWFRQRYQVAHRYIGRVYVFGGVLPAGLAGLVVGAGTPYGPAMAASNVMLALLWLTCTVAGYRMARQRRYVDHRRWMLRSFALTFSIITNRVWSVILFLALSPQLETTFKGDETMFTWAIASTGGWLGWTVPLLIVEWWLERGDASRRRARSRQRA
ncbi:DUF2306 domain-containing protein [Sphaerisporangium aureirubrum]|uniref:DUF2306 domain-containing protein n=1 Tax=Sphaerisporangium aureirubrum TaxID=1544736 RepID=A0ABW1NKP3_9ACTN